MPKPRAHIQARIALLIKPVQEWIKVEERSAKYADLSTMRMARQGDLSAVRDSDWKKCRMVRQCNDGFARRHARERSIRLGVHQRNIQFRMVHYLSCGVCRIFNADDMQRCALLVEGHVLVQQQIDARRV